MSLLWVIRGLFCRAYGTAGRRAGQASARKAGSPRTVRAWLAGTVKDAKESLKLPVGGSRIVAEEEQIGNDIRIGVAWRGNKTRVVMQGSSKKSS